MKGTRLLYEDIPKYDNWMRPLVSGLIAFFLILGLAFLYFNTELAITMFSLTVFLGLLFWAILPRRLEIYDDRVRIQLGGPFAHNVPLAHIDKAQEAPGSYALAYWGIRYGTSTSNVVEIVRHKGFNVIVTPLHQKEFINQLNQAVRQRSESTAAS